MIQLKNAAYGGGTGHYGVIDANHNCSWHSCRVGFQNSMQNKKDMAFVHKGGANLAQIRNFIKTVEGEAGIKDGADFEDTNLDNTVFIDLHFWCSQRMRLSLFTLLLRGGMQFPSIETAVMMEQYMRPTCGAIGRFMSGYTCFEGHQEQQWFDVFQNANDEKVEQLLQKEPTLDFDEGILTFGKRIIKAATKRGGNNQKLQSVCEMLEEILKRK